MVDSLLLPPTQKAVWHSQVKRIETWMLRIFFSCSVAFKVPVKDLWTLEVVGFAALLLVALLGKVVTGVFGPSPPQVLFPKPTVFFTIGCAMSAWGEFAFVVANTSLDLGIMKPGKNREPSCFAMDTDYFVSLFISLARHLRLRRAGGGGECCHFAVGSIPHAPHRAEGEGQDSP